jgi:hypothetical protein
MNNKEFKKKSPLENDMKKRFNNDTEFGREFINPLYELDMMLNYTNNDVDRDITNKKKIQPKK